MEEKTSRGARGVGRSLLAEAETCGRRGGTVSRPCHNRVWLIANCSLLLAASPPRLAEPIADSANRLDQVPRAELAPQGLDVNINGPFQHDGAFADGRVHELRSRERPARLAQHALQQPKLGRRQIQLAALDVGPVPHSV